MNLPEVNDLLDASEATTQLYMNHNAILQALRDKRYADAAHISSLSVEWHMRLQAWLNKIQ